jgi:hypothetical protein
MNSKALFLLGCIPARLFLVWLSRNIPVQYLKFLGAGLLIIGLHSLYLYFTNGRLDAFEAGGKTWWADFRLIFGSLLVIAAIYCFQGKQDMVWIPLTIDVIFGLLLFLIKRA